MLLPLPQNEGAAASACGDKEHYDTLDNIILARSNVEELYAKLSICLTGTVGIAISGINTLSGPTDGWWGRAVPLSTGEYLQMRMYPRNSFGKPLGPLDFRLVATRRTSHDLVPVVAFAVLFLPRVEFKDMETFTPSNKSSATIGCRSIHLLLPSLICKHDPHRSKEKGHIQLDSNGYHCIRPSCVTIPTVRGCSGGKYEFAVASGDSYLVIAGHMAGVDIPDPMKRCAETCSNSDYSKTILSKQRKLIQSIGEHDAGSYIYSALTICELISAEGLLSIMCNDFFLGALPDMMHSPVGLPLSICMAIHLACYPERFGLPCCTKEDIFANKEIILSFKSRWKPVSRGVRALDLAVKNGFDNAAAACCNDVMKHHMNDSMVLWQRIGQRLIRKVMCDPREDLPTEECNSNSTMFGYSELIADETSNFKYNHMAKFGLCQPVPDSPVDKISLAPLCDIRTALYRVLDTCEFWLRTGFHGEFQISKDNVSTTTSEHTNGEDTSSEENDDADDELNHTLNVAAMESARGCISTSMLHGPFSQHQFGIKSFLVGPGCCNTCADCDNKIDSLQAILFASKSSSCKLCNRHRCFKCSVDALKPDKSSDGCCRRCDPAAPRMRVSPTRATLKKTKR